MSDPGPCKGIGKEQARGFYREMLLIRRFEEKAGQLYGMGLIGGHCHLSIGQEAVAVGVRACLRQADTVITGHRCHGHMLASGADPARLMAELTGRRDGFGKGKGGSMHLFSPKAGFYGGHGIVGAPVPLGAGLAFAHAYKKDGGICVAILGDGAIDQGQVYESLKLAAMMRLPILFVIENNQLDQASAADQRPQGQRLCDRGQPFGIEGETVDGMDVEAVVAKVSALIKRVRHPAPMLLEAMTERYRGHSLADPAKYQNPNDPQAVRERQDVIERYRETLLARAWIEPDQIKAIDKEIRNIVNAAARFAQESPQPDDDELMTDILAGA